MKPVLKKGAIAVTLALVGVIALAAWWFLPERRAEVIVPTGVQHWVLLVGRDQKEYLMKDPLGDGKSLQPLSSLGSDILAVRVVKRM